MGLSDKSMYSHMWLPIQMEHERETIFSLYTPHNNPISLPLRAGPPKHTDSIRKRGIGEGDVGSLTSAVPWAI